MSKRIQGMEYINISNSDLMVSRLCMGGCPLGGYGWGAVEEDELLRSIYEALEKGVTFFDTADTYGLGKSEELLGRGLGRARNKVVVATKFGVRIENGRTFYDNSPKWINDALKGSLKRLGTDHVDIYQVHYRDGKTDIEDVIETLEKLKEKGYIRHYGLSNIYRDDIDELKKLIGKFVCFQDEYSLACRKNEDDMILISNTLQLSPLTWGSLGQGILTGKYDESTVFDKDDRRSKEAYVNFHGEKLLRNLKIVNVMRNVSERVNKPVPTIAIRWILDYLKGSIVITGIKNARQLDENTKAFDWKLDEGMLAELDEVSRD